MIDTTYLYAVIGELFVNHQQRVLEKQELEQKIAELEAVLHPVESTPEKKPARG